MRERGIAALLLRGPAPGRLSLSCLSPIGGGTIIADRPRIISASPFSIGLDMDVVQRRKALADALTAHDGDAVSIFTVCLYSGWLLKNVGRRP